MKWALSFKPTVYSATIAACVKYYLMNVLRYSFEVKPIVISALNCTPTSLDSWPLLDNIGSRITCEPRQDENNSPTIELLTFIFLFGVLILQSDRQF